MLKRVLSTLMAVAVMVAGIQFAPMQNINAAVESEEKNNLERIGGEDLPDITKIYVVTDEENPIITKAQKTSANITVISGEEAVNSVSSKGTIKLRGNSTALADKPAYNISFEKKQTLFTGAEKGKKWCLLANAYEKTMLRNKLAMDFGRALGNVAAPEEHFAELYINGSLKGTFVISEPAENGRAGIEYDEDDDHEMMFEWEWDRVEDGQTYYRTDMARFVVEDPEGLDTNSVKFRNWTNTLRNFENALRDTGSDRVFNYIDMDSFVDMYIVNEYFGTVDIGYSSVKFYIKKDADGNPRIHAGSLWDFDLSSGNSGVAECRDIHSMRCQTANAWFGYLMRNNTFKNKVIEKFKAVQPRVQNIYKENQLGISQINQNLSYMSKAKDRNYSPVSEGGAGWSESRADSAEANIYPYGYNTIYPYNTYTYEQHIDYLENWLEERDKYLCSIWGINYEEAGKQQLTSKDVAITGYQMTSTLKDIEGNMGMRVVYQTEPEIAKQPVIERGLIYGISYGDNPITEADMIYKSSNEYVETVEATEAGKANEILGKSETASYYVMTMECGADYMAPEAFTTNYYVRAYAKLKDGSIIYSNVKSYTIYKVANYIYQSQAVNNKSTYDYIYRKILKYVNNDYEEGNFDWGNIIIKK